MPAPKKKIGNKLKLKLKSTGQADTKNAGDGLPDAPPAKKTPFAAKGLKLKSQSRDITRGTPAANKNPFKK